jgi:hypothetical protein
MREEILEGGVANAGAVVRTGSHVLRPAGPHADAIDALLTHLHAAGFDGAPRPAGRASDGRARFAFIPGDVPLPPYPAWWWSDGALASTAALLRRYHDAAAGFVAPAGASWSEDLADPRGGAVLCHNDVCPENVVFRDGVAVALLDFDFAAPGRDVYDVAQLVKMCVPLPGGPRTAEGSALDPFRRLRLVTDAYGLDPGQAAALVDAIGDALDVGDRFVERRARAGEPAFVAMWRGARYRDGVRRRRAWFERHRGRLAAAVAAAG